MSQLESLIAQLSHEAEDDSSGTFTMDARQALSKLGRFQLGHSKQWVLKLIQAAVVWGAASVSVRCDTEEIVVELEASPPTLEEVEQAFYRPQTESDRGLQHLKVALWNLALGQENPFVVSFPACDHFLEWHQGQLIRRMTRQIVSQFRLAVPHQQLAALARDRLLEQLPFARACPIPVLAGAFKLDPCGAQAACSLRHGPVRVTVYQAGLSLSQGDRVCWVYDGVIIGTTELATTTNFWSEICIEDSTLGVDLSGFKLVSRPDPSWVESIDRLLQEVHQRLLEENPAVNRPPNHTSVVMLGGISVAGFATAINPVLGVILGIGALIATIAVAPRSQQVQQTRQADLRLYLEWIALRPWKLPRSES